MPVISDENIVSLEVTMGESNPVRVFAEFFHDSNEIWKEQLVVSGGFVDWRRQIRPGISL
jgi:hypothetical protein